MDLVALTDRIDEDIDNLILQATGLRLYALAELEDDWNGEGALRPDTDTIKQVSNFLKYNFYPCDNMLDAHKGSFEPILTPMINGGIRLTWNLKVIKVSVVFTPNNTIARGEVLMYNVDDVQWEQAEMRKNNG